MAAADSKAFKRLSKELINYSKSSEATYSTVKLIQENILHWQLSLQGPTNTPYEGGTFNLELKFPDNYPIKPPDVKFNTSIYHPNVSMKAGGTICQEIISKD